MHNPSAMEIESAINAQDISEICAQHSARINAALESIKLSPYALYCHKTGQPIGKLDVELLHTTYALFGREKLAELLYMGNPNSIHPAWKQTASNETEFNEILDRLCERDPRSYACYCFGIIAAQIKPLDAQKNNQHVFWVDWHWSLARAWQIMQLFPQDQLAELNETLCAFIYYMPSSLKKLKIGTARLTPDLLARNALSGDLASSLDHAITDTLRSIEDHNIAASRPIWQTNLAMEALANGPSQIKRQYIAFKKRQLLQKKERAVQTKQLSRLQENEKAFGFGKLFGIDVEPGKETWRTDASKFDKLRNTAIPPKEVVEIGGEEIPIEFFASLSLEDFAAPGEDDNKVEVRRLSQSEYEAVSERATIAPASEQPSIQAPEAIQAPIEPSKAPSYGVPKWFKPSATIPAPEPITIDEAKTEKPMPKWFRAKQNKKG